MAVEIKVPALGESVTEATVAKWLVKAGDTVAIDQPLCELETDKVTVEVNATVAGTIVDLALPEGTTGPAADRHAGEARRSAAARRPRGAGAHDAAAPHHRQPPEGGAEHSGHAHHLQRGGHDQRHGAARAPEGRFREEARRAAWLHVVLRQGLHRRAEGAARGQCGDRGR